MRRPGGEPGSTAWKATMLTVTPPTLPHRASVKSESEHRGSIEISSAFWSVVYDSKNVLSSPSPVPSLWRNRLARSAVNRKVGGSSPPRDVLYFEEHPFTHEI